MGTLSPIPPLWEARLTPFQNSMLILLAEAAGLPAELMLDILLMEAVLIQFLSKTQENFCSQDILEGDA